MMIIREFVFVSQVKFTQFFFCRKFKHVFDFFILSDWNGFMLLNVSRKISSDSSEEK